jgi:hypothetical protein
MLEFDRISETIESLSYESRALSRETAAALLQAAEGGRIRPEPLGRFCANADGHLRTWARVMERPDASEE